MKICGYRETYLKKVPGLAAPEPLERDEDTYVTDSSVVE
mgnify:CR=1 FL=1